jgi:hypothetical protein
MLNIENKIDELFEGFSLCITCTVTNDFKSFEDNTESCLKALLKKKEQLRKRIEDSCNMLWFDNILVRVCNLTKQQQYEFIKLARENNLEVEIGSPDEICDFPIGDPEIGPDPKSIMCQLTFR